MPITEDRPLAIYYEHPDWFRPLFQELDRRGVPHLRLDARTHAFDPAEAPRYGLAFNRMSPSAPQRGLTRETFGTVDWIAWVERAGVPVVNGLAAWQIEMSKARQVELFRTLGLAHPAACVITDPADVSRAAQEIGYPVVVKPNVGGSGAGIVRFDTAEELEAAAQGGALDLGPDGTALVQEYLAPEGGCIQRVEVLGGRYLYAIRVYLAGDSFNLCPADICHDADGRVLERSACPADAPSNGLRVEAFTAPPEVVDEVERIVQAAEIDVGGVEYLVAERDGRRYYYDVNALSNFVADAESVIGFDPHERLVDWLVRGAGR